MNFKKYHVSRNLWDENYTNISTSLAYKAFYVGDGIFTASTDCPISYPSGSSSLFFIAGNVSTGASSENNLYNDRVRTVESINGYVTIAYRITGTVNPNDYNTMINSGTTTLPYEPYSSEVWHDIPYYIHNTFTDTLTTLPADIYANDTTATVGLKGNMSQTGTPTPTTPIQPQETGERTGNLFDISTVAIGKYIDANGQEQTSSGTGYLILNHTDYVPVISNTAYTFQMQKTINNAPNNAFCWFDSNKTLIYRDTWDETSEPYIEATFTAPSNAAYLIVNFRGEYYNTGILNTGSTPLPYEPYGYKIPILNNSQTTNVYLGEVQSTRQIKKLEFDGTEEWQESGVVSGRIVGQLPISTPYTEDFNTPAECIMCSHIVPMLPYPSDVLNRVAMNKYQNGTIYISFTDEIIGGHSFTNFTTYLQQQYATGTPVCVWYVLATPETAVVNEPLRKISTYADEVSGITIPTIAGANVVDVLTTLKPSEVTATYKGWHPVQSVHERENGAWT